MKFQLQISFWILSSLICNEKRAIRSGLPMLGRSLNREVMYGHGYNYSEECFTLFDLQKIIDDCWIKNDMISIVHITPLKKLGKMDTGFAGKGKKMGSLLTKLPFYFRRPREGFLFSSLREVSNDFWEEHHQRKSSSLWEKPQPASLFGFGRSKI